MEAIDFERANASRLIDVIRNGSGRDSIFRHLRDKIFISMRYGYTFVSVAKSGASTTKAVLWDVEELGPRPASLHQRPDDDPRPSPISAPFDIACDALFSDRFFRFTIWRDPVSRLLSAYRDKMVRAPVTWPSWIEKRQRIADALSIADAETISFDQFAHFVCEQPDRQRDVHWMSQWRLGLHDYLSYDAVIDLKNYDLDLASTLRRIGIPEERIPEHGERHNVSPGNSPDMSDETVARIREAFSQDYEIIRNR